MSRISIIIVILFFPFLVIAQTRGELEARKESALKDLEEARQLLEQTEEKKSNTIQRLSIINSSIKSREQLIKDLETTVYDLDFQIDSLETRIKIMNKDIATGKEEYERIIISIYKNHTNEEKIMYLLASESFNQFYQRIKYLKYLNDYRERKVNEIENLVIDLQSRKDELVGLKLQKQSILEESLDENTKLRVEKQRRNQLVNKLIQDEKKFREEIKKKKRVSAEIDDKIKEIIEAEARKSAGNTLYASLTPEQKLVGVNFVQNKGRLPWPVDRGVVTAEYGLIPHPVLSGVKLSNNGIDISSAEGSKARAVFDGEVLSVSFILGANSVVLIMHGEYISVYQNLVDLKVKAGDKVITKQELGTIHSNPEDHVAILHFQVRKSRETENPRGWLSK